MVVEDDPCAREFVAESLRRHGADVVTARTAREGLTILHSAHVDVIISDLSMPEMTGIDFVAEVRELAQGGPPIPAIAYTAFSGLRAQSVAAGFQVHIVKPVDPRILVLEVARLAGV